MNPLLRLLGGGGFQSGTAPVVVPPVDYPTTADARLTMLRPDGRRIGRVTVDLAKPISTKNFHSLADAINAAKIIQYAPSAQDSVTWTGFAHPDYRVDIFVYPGVYTETFGTADFINIIGVTGNPNDVVFQSGADSGGVMHSYGNIYVEGITLHALAPTQPIDPLPGPKYSLHLTQERSTLIMANVRLVCENPGHAVMGMDGGSNALAYFYRCYFQDGLSPAGASTNMHGGSGHDGPVQIVFDNCPSMTGPQYSPGGDGSIRDQVWAINGTPTDNFLTSDGVDNITLGEPGAQHGLSAWQRANLLPSYVGGPFPQRRIYPANDTKTMNPVVGRTYFVPIPLAGGSVHTTGPYINVTTAAGKYASAVLTQVSVRDRPEQVSGVAPDMNSPDVVVGENYHPFYYFQTLGASNTAYVAIAFDSPSASIAASTAITADLPCWYTDDGVTLVRASGVLFPLAGLKSAK